MDNSQNCPEMHFFNFFIHPLLIWTCFSEKTSYFCDLNCKHIKHTVCKLYPCRPHKLCGRKWKMLQLDDEARTWVVEIHNSLRNNVASGNDTRGDNTIATNVNVLSYSKELEFVAQCWANRCGVHTLHDICRSIISYPIVGQNTYRAWSATDDEPFTSRQDLVTAIENCDKAYEYFTQLLWAETRLVGCGRVRFGEHEGMSIMFVCNYATGGNIEEMEVYKPGKRPCSNCMMERCNAEYKSLCGRIRPLKDDLWLAPFKLEATTFTQSLILLVILLALQHFL